MAVAAHRMTLEDFETLPEEKPALEFESGKVTQKPMPRGKHSRLQYKLTEQVNVAAAPSRAAQAYPELRVRVAGSSYVPDVSIFLWNRIPQTPEGEVADIFHAVPDATAEIVSPDQSVNGLVRKCRGYVANGVKIALLIDPKDRSVLAFHPDGRLDSWQGEDRVELDTIFSGFELTVNDLFASLRLD